MVAADILYALFLQLGDALGVEHQLLQFMVDAFVVGLHIDDGAQLRLMEQGTVLSLFCSSWCSSAIWPLG